jgi:hypothetical protein
MKAHSWTIVFTEDTLSPLQLPSAHGRAILWQFHDTYRLCLDLYLIFENINSLWTKIARVYSWKGQGNKVKKQYRNTYGCSVISQAERRLGLPRVPGHAFLPCVTQLMTVFCVHLVTDQAQTGASGLVHLGRRKKTVHHVQNHTLLGHSPSDSQAGRRVGQAL